MDAFALLELPRRVALEADEVRLAFQKAAAACHPDGAADETERLVRTERFQQLNAASALLVPVASRLKHWLALEAPDFTAARAAVMDEELVALFSQVGDAVRAAAEWTKARQAATSFLAKAALTGREMQVQEALESAGAAVRAAQEKLLSGLAAVDAARESGDAAGHAPEVVSALAQRAVFFEKWQAQLQAAWAAVFSAGT
jgi:hypothetical protein